MYTKDSIDPATSFFFTPRTVTLLFAGLAVLTHYAHVWSDPPVPATAAPAVSAGPHLATAVVDSTGFLSATADNAERGIWAAALVFLGYSALQGPSTSMVRPHPAIWRLVHGVMVLYVVLLVWMVCQDVDDARAFMRHLSAGLGTPIDARTYAGDCRLYVRGAGINWATLRPTLLDEFVVAHFIGWWAKALVVRNYALLWAISVLFEVVELTLQHMLPNFNECWWDRWVLDVAVCNLLGILAGMATVRWFDCKYEQYNWQGVSQLPTFSAKARRTVAQLLPYSWDKFRWMAFSSPRRLLQSLFVVLLVLAFELNVFFLKHALWVPPTNPLNTYRLMVWFLCALPAVREYYEYVEGRSADVHGYHKLGTFAWLAIAMTCLESCMSYKFGRGLYPEPWPPHVVHLWAGCLGCAAAALVIWQALQYRRNGAGWQVLQYTRDSTGGAAGVQLRGDKQLAGLEAAQCASL